MLLDSYKKQHYREWERTRWLGWATFNSTVDWGKQPFAKTFEKPIDLFTLEGEESQKEVKPDKERAFAAFEKYKKLKEDGDKQSRSYI